jgi:hypothetical protein
MLGPNSTEARGDRPVGRLDRPYFGPNGVCFGQPGNRACPIACSRVVSLPRRLRCRRHYALPLAPPATGGGSARNSRNQSHPQRLRAGRSTPDVDRSCRSRPCGCLRTPSRRAALRRPEDLPPVSERRRNQASEAFRSETLKRGESIKVVLVALSFTWRTPGRPISVHLARLESAGRGKFSTTRARVLPWVVFGRGHISAPTYPSPRWGLQCPHSMD